MSASTMKPYLGCLSRLQLSAASLDCSSRLDGVLVQPRVDARELLAEPEQRHAHLVQLEQHVVEGRVRVRRQEHRLARRRERSHLRDALRVGRVHNSYVRRGRS